MNRLARTISFSLVSLSLGACQVQQSILAPHGSIASEIAALGWLLFVLAPLS